MDKCLCYINDLCNRIGTTWLTEAISTIYTEAIVDETGVKPEDTTTTTVDMNAIGSDEVNELQGDIAKTVENNEQIDKAKQDISNAISGNASDAELQNKISEYNAAKQVKGEQVAEMTAKLNAASAQAQQDALNQQQV